MRIKILIMLLFTVLLGSCLNNTDKEIIQTNPKGSIENEKLNSDMNIENTIVDMEEKTEEINLINTGTTVKANKEEVIELKKLNKKRNSEEMYNFYTTDCKQEYKTEGSIKQCQQLSLKETVVLCSSEPDKLRGKISEYFSYQKYDLLNQKFVNAAKNYCINYDIELQKADKQSSENLDKLENFIETFTLNKCSTIAQKEFEEMKENNDEDEVLDEKSLKFRCEVIYGLEKGCDELSGNSKIQCEKMKTEIDNNFLFNIETQNETEYSLEQYAKYESLDTSVLTSSYNSFYAKWDLFEKIKEDSLLAEIVSW